MTTRVVITGAGGQLGRDLVRAFAGYDVVALDRAGLDVADRDAVLSTLLTIGPDIVVHGAAWTAVDACETDPARAWAVNALGCRHVADAVRRGGAYLCAISTDYVFDGRAERPYVEWDATAPLGMYGRSKLGGETEIWRGAPGASVVRSSWLWGAGGPNFVTTMLRLARRRDDAGGAAEVPVVADQCGSPTFTADLASAVQRLAAARLPGLFHITNQGAATWHDLARETFSAAGEDPERVRAISTAELDPPRLAPRPAYSVLDNAALRSSGLPLLPDYHESLEPLVRELANTMAVT